MSYTANALNQYTAVGAVTPTYDANGNLTSDGTFTYGYDAENRLISATGAGNTASYSYDGQGRRKSKTVNGTATVFVGDGDQEALEYDGTSGAVLRRHVYGTGLDEPLNRIDVSGARVTLVPDIQGSIVASVDAATGTVTQTPYQTYGESADTSGSYRYTARRIDAETNGLYYYRARMYSPVLGRFLQADPIGYAGGRNLYAYVGNDPLNRIDPTGQWLGVDDAAAILGGFVAGVAGQGIADIVTGQLSSSRTYIASGVGSATAAEVALYTVPTLGPVGLVPAGALGGVAYNVTNGVNLGTLPGDILIGAGTSFIPGVGATAIRRTVDSAATGITNPTAQQFVSSIGADISRNVTDSAVGALLGTANTDPGSNRPVGVPTPSSTVGGEANPSCGKKC